MILICGKVGHKRFAAAIMSCYKMFSVLNAVVPTRTDYFQERLIKFYSRTKQWNTLTFINVNILHTTRMIKIIIWLANAVAFEMRTNSNYYVIQLRTTFIHTIIPRINLESKRNKVIMCNKLIITLQSTLVCRQFRI